MGFGVSIFLIALGAILAWAVRVETGGIDLNMVGLILLGVGAIGLALSLLMWSSWAPWQRERVVREDTYDRRPPPR